MLFWKVDKNDSFDIIYLFIHFCIIIKFSTENWKRSQFPTAPDLKLSENK